MAAAAKRRRLRKWRRRETEENEEKRREEETAEAEKMRRRLERVAVALKPTFLSNIRRGIILNDEELRAVARRKGIGSLTQRDLDFFRQSWPHLQRFRDDVTRHPAPYQTIIRSRLGLSFADVAFLGDKRKNGGFIGFLLCVEAVTGVMAAVPLKNKKMTEFQDAFERLIRLTQMDSVHLILCDRETRQDFFLKAVAALVIFLFLSACTRLNLPLG